MNTNVLVGLVAALSAAAGVGATLWVARDETISPPAAAEDRELRELRQRLEDLEARLPGTANFTDDADGPLPAAVRDLPARQTEATEPAPSEPEAPRPRQRDWEQRERERLLAAGWTEPEVEEVQNINSSVRLRMLEERHMATREMREKYPDMIRMLQLDWQDPLRESLGDDRYASYLEATGRPSAVNVRSLIPGSAGEQVGLRAGDVIRSYAGERVFTFMDIERATLEGKYGEPVTLEVERDGATYYLTIPRGPIGTTFRGRN